MALDKKTREAYEQHPFWGALKELKEGLAVQEFQNPTHESYRKELVEVLDTTQKLSAKAPPGSYLYKGLLDSTQSYLTSYFKPTESSVSNYPSYHGSLYDYLRQLPVQPKNLPTATLDRFTNDVAARTNELKELEQQIEQSQQTLERLNDSISDLASRHDALLTATKESKESLHTVTVEQINTIKSDATDRLNTIKSALSDQASNAKQTFTAKMKEIDTAATAELNSMKGLRDVGAKLLSVASGTLVATSWADRAAKEKKTATQLRNFSYCIFALSIIAGVFFLIQSFFHAEGLTVGDGILRASLTLALAGFGGIVLRESGQHKVEGDTAQDISLSLAGLSTFYASADKETQNQARKELGEAVMIKNIISRYSNRDASKHSQPIDLKDVTSAVSETIKATK